MKEPLFLDANIIFSAAYRQGLARVLFQLGKAGRVSLITSDWVLEEARRNLQIKFQDSLTCFQQEILPVLSVQAPDLSNWVCPVELNEKDRPVLGAAIILQAAYLITGDARHFGHLFGQTIQGVTILPQRQYFQREWGLDQ